MWAIRLLSHRWIFTENKKQDNYETFHKCKHYKCFSQKEYIECTQTNKTWVARGLEKKHKVFRRGRGTTKEKCHERIRVKRKNSL
jgi:hypothetical protein